MQKSIFSMAVEQVPAYRNLGWCSCPVQLLGAPAAPQLTCLLHVCLHGHAARHAVGGRCWITLTLREDSLGFSMGRVRTEGQAQGQRGNHAKEILENLCRFGAIWQPSEVSSESHQKASSLGELSLEGTFIFTTTFRKPKLSKKSRCTSIKAKLSF